MKTTFFCILFMVLPLTAQASLEVLACEPEWAALAEEIGGDMVKTSSATNPLQDPHYIQARPSLIAKVRRADLIICSGAQLEIGWLPMLLQRGNNPSVTPPAPGFLEASSFVSRLDVTGLTDRSQGDMHPQGNPHVQTNPHNIRLVANAVAERLAQVDAENAEFYRQRLADFTQRWTEAISGWEERAAPLRGKRVIAHHKSWVYLEDWLGLEEVATLEPVPGVPPTATHLSTLLRRFEGDEHADFIIRAPFQNDKSSNWLSERTGIPAVMLPLTVGGSDQATDLFRFFDDIIDRLLSAQG
ncbi:MAG: zinc ABC transporter substrate-binding protein [Xanthomonadales bacterium]|nr:zinc ABC transporter substrate-binding protein [Xanthomonadales bacterium]